MHKSHKPVRKCDDCNKAYFYPRNICPDCGNNNTSWIVASGKAKVHTFAIVHRPDGYLDLFCAIDGGHTRHGLGNQVFGQFGCHQVPSR